MFSSLIFDVDEHLSTIDFIPDVRDTINFVVALYTFEAKEKPSSKKSKSVKRMLY